MTALKDILLAQIARFGPLSVADYMAACLFHPQHGYYATRDPLGAAGDFTTAPEISQMFGELIGLWFAQVWMDQGAPSEVHLVELGPGRGTLMADLYRATRSVPGFHSAMTVHLIEASPVLKAQQAETIQGPDLTFHDTLDTVPEGPFYCVANEFFDALPIRQFQRGRKDDWHERMIGSARDQLIWGLAPAQSQDRLTHRNAAVSEGQLVETCAPAEAIAQEMGRRIAAHGGAGLIIDYGDWESIGDTLQALRTHAPIDPLETPGEADLTAHVAFEPISRAANAVRASKLTPQGVFLERLGITARAQALARHLGGTKLETHIAAHERLTHPARMGHLFKVLALTPRDAPSPPALE